MRRTIISAGAVAVLLFLTVRCEGGPFLHRHGGVLLGRSPAQPLSLGFINPGLAGVNIDVMQMLSGLLGQQRTGQDALSNILGRFRQQDDALKVDQEVKTKVNGLQTQVNAGVDELNKLTQRMNASKAKRQFFPEDLRKEGFADVPRTSAVAAAAGKSDGPIGKSKEGP